MFVMENAWQLTPYGGIPGEYIPEEDDDVGPEFAVLRAVSANWHKQGRPRFVLTASMAALMVSTKAPLVSYSDVRFPYDYFLIEVPGEWTSAPGVGPLLVLLARNEKGWLLVASRKTTPGVPASVGVRIVTDGDYLSESESTAFSRRHRRKPPAFMVEAIRYLINTSLFVTAHKECAPARDTGKRKARSVIHDVRPPQSVSVTSDFRRHAQNLVANRRIAERKDALLHIVRGHWKNQPTGKGRVDRSMIWVQPYQRGVDSLGRIVERTIRVSDA